MSKRVFEVDDPGLPKSGLLVGRGGGLMRTYFDFTADVDGTISLLHYDSVDGRIPSDYQSAELGVVELEDIREMMGRLDKIGFWKIEPVPVRHEETRYLVMINEKKGLHYLFWGVDDQPFPKDFHEVYEAIKTGMIKSFLNVVE